MATVGTIHPSLVDLPTATETPRDAGRALETIGQPLASRGGGMEGRHDSNRRSLALGNGGSEASESAVERGLAWLAAHQFDDGGWRFDLKSCPQCGGQCKNSGVIESTTASTGLALLCFLGAGYTQDEGPYQEVVSAGLYYLIDKMLITSMGGDLRDNSLLDELVEGQPQFRKSGDMYSHGIATLALCEAYAMTRDKTLAEAAQQAVNFIVYAQHEKGGWRYAPKEPGDTTVSGWQVTALKSALLAKLDVPRGVWYRASDYFDSVQEDRGATYGYQSPDKNRISTSVVGLFSRMILGWPRNHPPLAKGMARIAKQYPHRNHMYFNYYASQALYHTGGPGWERWNPRMREYLVNLQASSGHESGSWYINENWSDRGGRLYTTALAILTLEVYYRYMPMYQKSFVGDSP
ncbi:MAG: terpene cyclase/mutase family protein [Planctomycetes bacterium]|nr:terpene cyclase/mutase family protein [Planctomycetota bacterium]